jgi:hypothetical protein
METGAVDDLKSSHPEIFGPNGGYSRCYSLSNVSFMMGLLVGPFLSGRLTESLGYYRMNSVLCRLIFIFIVYSSAIRHTYWHYSLHLRCYVAHVTQFFDGEIISTSERRRRA